MKKLRLLFFVFGALMLFVLSTTAAHAQEIPTTNDANSSNSSANGEKLNTDTTETLSTIETTKDEVIKQESQSNISGTGVVEYSGGSGLSSNNAVLQNNQTLALSATSKGQEETSGIHVVTTFKNDKLTIAKAGAASFTSSRVVKNTYTQTSTVTTAAPSLIQSEGNNQGAKLPFSIPGTGLLMASAISPVILNGAKLFDFTNPFLSGVMLLFIGCTLLLISGRINSRGTWTDRLRKSRFINAARSDLASINFENEPLIRSALVRTISRLFSCFVLVASEAGARAQLSIQNSLHVLIVRYVEILGREIAPSIQLRNSRQLINNL